MIEKLMLIFRESTFDFKQFAYINDPLKCLFDSWIDYYKMKYAICKYLRPKKLLEIGVRYGYSCMAFLNAVPDLHYVGIDADLDVYGGSHGALEWARKQAKGYDASFLVADTQKMDSFPGGRYDLIHVDGQQDGEGTFRDLEKAFFAGDYILLDGFTWTRLNVMAGALFLEKYRKNIEYAVFIPGYAGDLLIKTKAPESLLHNHCSKRPLYDRTYFLCDCKGYDNFLAVQNGEHRFHPQHLASVHILSPKKGQRILDLGSGRGELSYLCAWAGANVTGIDYSGDAVTLAQETFSSRPEVQGRLEYRMEDALAVEFSESVFDAIVATDFVEHIESGALDKVLANIVRWLSPQGRLVIHTSPNALAYGKAYSKKRKNAEDAGLFLPSNPRTFYEDVMHVNEQTPARLRRTLRRFFRNVIVWVAPQPLDTGSLGRECSRAECGEWMCIFAVASNAPLQNSDVLSRMTQYPLKELWSAELEVLDCPVKVRTGEKFSVRVRFHNTSSEVFSSMPPNPVHLSYHWKDPTGKTIVHDGQRTQLPFPFLPGQKINISIDVCPPSDAGTYVLELTAVNEYAFWFEAKIADFSFKRDVIIVKNE